MIRWLGNRPHPDSSYRDELWSAALLQEEERNGLIVFCCFRIAHVRVWAP